jgi:hypothetical protein
MFLFCAGALVFNHGQDVVAMSRNATSRFAGMTPTQEGLSSAQPVAIVEGVSANRERDVEAIALQVCVGVCVLCVAYIDDVYLWLVWNL